PGTGAIDALSLAPSGDAWVVVRGGQAWLSMLERSDAGVSARSVPLPTELSASNRSFGVAWTTSGVVLHDHTGAELFSRATLERKWKTLIATENVTFATGVGESVVLLTSTGLQILDPSGQI